MKIKIHTQNSPLRTSFRLSVQRCRQKQVKSVTKNFAITLPMPAEPSEEQFSELNLNTGGSVCKVGMRKALSTTQLLVRHISSINAPWLCFLLFDIHKQMQLTGCFFHPGLNCLCSGIKYGVNQVPTALDELKFHNVAVGIWNLHVLWIPGSVHTGGLKQKFISLGGKEDCLNGQMANSLRGKRNALREL